MYELAVDLKIMNKISCLVHEYSFSISIVFKCTLITRLCFPNYSRLWKVFRPYKCINIYGEK